MNSKSLLPVIALIALVLSSQVHDTKSQLPSNFMIKIRNKGWYVAEISVYYKVRTSIFGPVEDRSESAYLATLQDKTFTIPLLAATAEPRFTLVAKAFWGKEIINMQFPLILERLCFHVWGTTLFPIWSPMECW